jgi:hypothetical protein
MLIRNASRSILIRYAGKGAFNLPSSLSIDPGPGCSRLPRLKLGILENLPGKELFRYRLNDCGQYLPSVPLHNS